MSDDLDTFIGGATADARHVVKSVREVFARGMGKVLLG